MRPVLGGGGSGRGVRARDEECGAGTSVGALRSEARATGCADALIRTQRHQNQQTQFLLLTSTFSPESHIGGRAFSFRYDSAVSPSRLLSST